MDIEQKHIDHPMSLLEVLRLRQGQPRGAGP